LELDRPQGGKQFLVLVKVALTQRPSSPQSKREDGGGEQEELELVESATVSAADERLFAAD